MGGRCKAVIVKIDDGSYERYEQLLLKRDQYRKEAGQILISYTKEFGDLINSVFEKKIECIRLKKTISLCQSCINRGETINASEIDARIRKEMALYYAELEKMLSETRAAKASIIVPAAVVVEIKRLYRKLARLLHPDINPKTSSIPDLKDLWNRILAAYHCNDLEELKELEVLALSMTDRQKDGDILISIPDIEEKIKRLEREISEIILTQPYTYKDVLADAAQIAEKKKSLQEELQEYEDYCQSLCQMLDGMLIRSGRKRTWRMNLH